VRETVRVASRALVTTLLARRSQVHQATLMGHLDPWSFEMAGRLQVWTNHFVARGADTYTAGRQAMAMLYRETVTQANILSYADDFWLLTLMFAAVPLFLPLMRRIRLHPKPSTIAAAETTVAHAAEEGAV